MACYLGVDGGGSKTAFALIDADGRVLARATAPSSYYFNQGPGQGFDTVEQVLRQGVTEICATAGITTAEIDQAFFGLPGYGEASADIEALDALPGRVPAAGVVGSRCGDLGRHRRSRRPRNQSTLTTLPPVSATSSSNVIGKTVCGVPPAAQISA